MPDESNQVFQSTGLSWGERAKSGEELSPVLSPGGTKRRNAFLHNITLAVGQIAARSFQPNGRIVDFGCGTGRFVRFFAKRGFNVLGTEITEEMLSSARRFGIPAGCSVELTDGVRIPADDASVDGIWCCGVLRFSLFCENPKYADIAREMFRVLKPGACVCNLEMYTDASPQRFQSDFENAGFKSHTPRITCVQGAKLESFVQRPFVPIILMPLLTRLIVQHRIKTADAETTVGSIRDCYFVWEKP